MTSHGCLLRHFTKLPRYLKRRDKKEKAWKRERERGYEVRGREREKDKYNIIIYFNQKKYQIK